MTISRSTKKIHPIFRFAFGSHSSPKVYSRFRFDPCAPPFASALFFILTTFLKTGAFFNNSGKEMNRTPLPRR